MQRKSQPEEPSPPKHACNTTCPWDEETFEEPRNDYRPKDPVGILASTSVNPEGCHVKCLFTQTER